MRHKDMQCSIFVSVVSGHICEVIVSFSRSWGRICGSEDLICNLYVTLVEMEGEKEENPTYVMYAMRFSIQRKY